MPNMAVKFAPFGRLDAPRAARPLPLRYASWPALRRAALDNRPGPAPVVEKRWLCDLHAAD